MANKEKAALYVRVSTHHQIDKDSLPFQRKELINYAKYILGIDNYEIFEDAGYSGKNMDRPKFQEMMTRIRSGEFTHLLVWKIDRVSRNLRDFTEMYDEIKKYSVTFISKNEQFDTSSAMGEAMLKIILVFAELERKLTGERVYSIMLSRAEKGQWNGAPIPLGYSWDEEQKFPVINDKEADIVRMIFNTYEQTTSSIETANILNQNKILSKKGSQFTSKTITDILKNPFYMGTYRYNYRESARGKIKPENEWIVVDDNHPAIVSKEQFERVGEIISKNFAGNSSKLRKNLNTHVFSGLIQCYDCGTYCLASQDRPRSDGYRPSKYRCGSAMRGHDCRNNIGEVKLGPFVLNYIANLVKAQEQLIKKKFPVSKFEKLLLQGDIFSNIAGIENEGLELTYQGVLYNKSGTIFERTEKTDKKENISTDEFDNLKKEKEKFERALKRLDDLYLFSDDAMSEKEYLIRKRDLTQNIDAVNVRIKGLNLKTNQKPIHQDFQFIKAATTFLFKQEMLQQEFIDYNSIIRQMDPQLLKDFINAVIAKVIVKKHNVMEIQFTNGISHKFLYK